MQDKPSVKELPVFGLLTGQTTKLTLTGANLAPTGVQVKAPLSAQLLSSKPTEALVEVRVPPDCPPESFELTLTHTKDSPVLKLPVLLSAAQELPVKKPLSRFDQAMLLAPAPSVSVQTNLDNDQPQLYRLALKAGESIEIAVTGARSPLSDCDPVVRLRDSRRLTRTMATGSTKRDRRLVFRAPDDGSYFIEVGDSQQRGGARLIYRLWVRRLP